MSVPKQRLLDLLKVQTRIFSQTYNPDRLRTGNSVLRERLRGPAVASYYPRRVATFKDLEKAYSKLPDKLETYDEHEVDRLEHLTLVRARGKGAPKKKRSKEDSKKMKGKKKPAVSAEQAAVMNWGPGPVAN